MKKILLILLAIAVLAVSGCQFKVEKNTFNVDRDRVDAIEIQREYKEGGKSVYRCKKILDPADLDLLCKKIRTLPVTRAGNKEAHPVDAYSLIVLIQGSGEHHLVLSEKMAYYDQIAYEYTDEVYEEFVELYENFGYEEEATEPTKFPSKKNNI